MDNFCKFLIFLISIIKKECNGLTMKEVIIPMHISRDEIAVLECVFDMDGEQLYSVKWYKDGNEFYRYLPGDNPPAQVFPLSGVTVDIKNSSSTKIVLSHLNLQSSGKYRCEVSGEAPSFQTVSGHGEMFVVALPKEDPKITGGKRRYQLGQLVRVNCTSGRSKPAATLHWYINGEQVKDQNMLIGPTIQVTGREGLERAILGLEFKVRGKHFQKGDMKLKCLATIAQLYTRSNEASVEGDPKYPQKAPVLESRETVPSGNFRADRVQAGQSCRVSQPSGQLVALCGLLSLVIFASKSISR